MESRKRIFMTVSAYVTGRLLGPEAGAAAIERQLANPGPDCMPCVRTAHRLNAVSDLELRVDTGGTVLGKVRSRHAHSAWESERPIWVSCDDDVEATSPTLQAMIEAVDDELVPSICVVPYAARGGPLRVDVGSQSRIIRERELPSGARLRCIDWGTLGLVAMNRAALRAVRDVSSHLEYDDDDDVTRLGLFHDQIDPDTRRWNGEDIAFFQRVPLSVRVEALLTGISQHGGVALDLSQVII